MERMKNTMTLAAALTMTFGLSVTVSAEGSVNKDIVILYTNDVHCGIDDYIGYDGLALYKREMQAEHENVLLVDAGDAIQGTSIGSISEGEYIISLMNKVGYDAATLGNHEFDYSVSVLQKRAAELECGYICCNFYDKGTGQTLFDPYKLINCGDTQIAFVGVSTPETFSKSTPVFFQNDEGEYIYSFAEEGTALYDIVQQNVDRAREDGADYVILLAHLGETYITEGWSAQEVIANTTGIDAVIDGHSHDTTPSLTVQNKDGADVTVTQTGTKLANIGKMTITDEGLTTELISEVPAPDETIPADSYTVIADRGGADRYVDSETNVKINELNAEIEKQNRKIGETAFTLYDCDPETGVRRVRNGETNLGNLCADAARAYYNAEIAILNGGGIRKTIQAGDIRYLDLVNTLPFGNSICVSKVTGQQILDYLENNVSSYPKENGGFPNVSGIEYTIDKSIESTAAVNEFGEFTGVTGEYRVKNVLINGKPLDKERTYTLASIDYLLKNGGDGYIFSGKSELCIDEGVLHADALADYIENDLGGIIPEEYRDPYGNGRIKETDGTVQEEEPVSEPENEPEKEKTTSVREVQPVWVPSGMYGRVAVTRNGSPTSGNAAQSGSDSSSASSNTAAAAPVPANVTSNGGENPATGAALSSVMIVSLVAIIVSKRKG